MLRVPMRLVWSLVVIASVGVAFVPRVVAQEPEPPRIFAVLGDGLIAGQGAPESVGPCLELADRQRTIAASIGFLYDGFVFEACGAATAGDLIDQLEAVPPAPAGDRYGRALVTIGRQDWGIDALIDECVTLADCTTQSDLLQVQDRLLWYQSVAPEIFAALIRVRANHEAGGQVNVTILGPPRPFAASGQPECDFVPGLSVVERSAINSAIDDLNVILQIFATVLPDTSFWGTDLVFDGHRLCDAQPWINGAAAPAGRAYYPNRDGHMELTDFIVEVLAFEGG